MTYLMNSTNLITRKPPASMRSSRLGLLAGVALAAALLPQRSANASLMITFTSGASTVTVTDQETSPVLDASPTVGEIITTTNVGTFGVQITVAVSNSPGSSSAGTLQITSLDITNSTNVGQQTLSILTSDTGYALPGNPPLSMNLNSAFTGTFGSGSQPTDNASFQSFADPNNGQPATANPTGPLSFSYPTTEAPNFTSFSGNNNVSWSRLATPYSLSDLTTVTLSPGASINITGTTTATAVSPSVPEPTLGVVPALALGLLARRRRNPAKA